METKAAKFCRSMIFEQHLMEKWRTLTPANQQQVLSFVELLASQSPKVSDAIAANLPTLEIWSPYGSDAAAQDLLKLLAADSGEDGD
jgi:hypothetical protein